MKTKLIFNSKGKLIELGSDLYQLRYDIKYFIGEILSNIKDVEQLQIPIDIKTL